MLIVQLSMMSWWYSYTSLDSKNIHMTHVWLYQRSLNLLLIEGNLPNLKSPLCQFWLTWWLCLGANKCRLVLHCRLTLGDEMMRHKLKLSSAFIIVTYNDNQLLETLPRLANGQIIFNYFQFNYTSNYFDFLKWLSDCSA